MNFVSLNSMFHDVQKWERLLPHFDAVCGVPRSGLLPASIISLRRNIRCIPLELLLEDPATAMEKSQLRATNPAVRNNRPVGNRVLVVDDAVSDRMVTLKGIQERLKGQTSLAVSYGAVYAATPHAELTFAFKYVPMPRMFGWNWYRHWGLQYAMLDMDGVICEDWRGTEKKDDPEYRKFLDNAVPLYLPEVKVRAIVTGRLEKYREQTVNYLARHGVKYGQLFMYPSDDPEVRRRGGMSSQSRKAAIYKADEQATLFVESDRRQAAIIRQLTRRPVLCVDSQEMLV